MTFNVEIRGPLTKKEYKILKKELWTHGKEIYYSDEFVIFFPENRNLKLKKNQLRIKVNNFGATIYLKDSRRGNVELILSKRLSETGGKTALRILGFLGPYFDVSVAPAKRFDYSYNGAMISIKTYCIIGPHFEIDKKVETKREINQAKQNLLEIAHVLNLRVWTDKEYKEHVENSWKNIRRLELSEVEKIYQQETIDAAKLLKRIVRQRKTK